MSERKKHTNRLLVFMGLLFLLSFLPWNTLNAKAAVTLSEYSDRNKHPFRKF